jgi:sugar lactone lactonase YvrE
MNGAENICFDGAGSMFISGLDGFIYRIAPTGNPYRGIITARKKFGRMCLGIESGPDGFIYAGVWTESGGRRIARISKNLVLVKFLTGDIEGLNGFEQRDGYLYFAQSDMGIFFPKGKISRAKFSDDESFNKPETVVDGAGMVNGLAFSPDGKTLYYTETFNGVWACDMGTGSRKKIFSPSGLLQVIDDLDVSPDGTVWACFNSDKAILRIAGQGAPDEYSIGELGAPSSCRFGRGPGFKKDFLYITEFGLKGRSTVKDGRGVWAFPVNHAGNQRHDNSSKEPQK